MVLTIAMLLTLVVVPASAAGPQVSVAMTADKTTVQRGSDQEILITVTLNNPAAETDRPTAISFDLKSANENVVLAEKATNRVKLAYSYVNDDDDTITGTATATYKTNAADKKGIFTFLYGDVTKTLPIKESSLELMTIKATIKANAPVGEYTISTEKMTIADTGDVGAIAKTIYDTNQTLTVTVVDALTGELPVTITAPAKGGTPETAISGTNYTGSITWEPTVTGGKFAANTAYTANVTLTAKTGYQFANGVNPTVAGSDRVTDVKVKDSGSKLEFKATFPATAAKDTPVITTLPTAGSINYGEMLYKSSLSGGEAKVGSTVVPGSFKWKEELLKPEVKDSNATEYEVVFKPNDTTSYETTTCKVKLTVNKKSLSSIIIHIDPQPYTGLEIKPDVTVKDGQPPYNPLAKSDYSVAYSNNKDVGTANYTIKETPTGNYKFNTSYGTFEIKKADSTISITSDPGKTYDGAAVTDPTVNKSGSTGAVTYTYYTDAACTTKTTTASGAASDGAAPKNAGDYWVVAAVAASANYNAATSAAKKFTISQKALTDSMITLGTQKTYNGTEQSVQIASVKDGAADLISTIDYAIEDGDKATDVGNNTLVIKGKGNYTGEASATWSLVARDVTITPDAKSKTYGEAAPELTYTTSIDGDTTLKAKFDEAKSGALSYTGTDVGAYIIGIGTLKAGNNFNLKLDTTAVFFTINQATPVITATTPRQLVNNGVEVDISDWASFTNTDSGAKLTYTLGSVPAGITLAGNKLKAASSVAAGATFEIKVNAYGTHNFTAPTEFTIHVTVVNKKDAGVSITTPPASKTYGDANFSLAATKSASAPDGGIWSWNSSNPAILEIVSGENTATPTIKVKKADTAGATLTVTYTTDTHYGSANTTITVAQKDVAISGITAANKEYDGSTTATPTGTAVINGKVGSDDVTVTAGTATFADKNVGTGKTVTFTGYSLSGADAGNYNLKAQPASVMANITAKDVKLTGGINATDRSYVKDNKTVDLTKGTLTFDGLVSGETLDVNIPATGTISDAKVGAYNVTYSGVTLKDGTTGKASNYKLVSPLPTVTVNITKASAPTLADIPVSQKYNVTTGEKVIGAVMPTDAGALTYTKGAESKTGSVTVTSWAVDATGKVTYTLSGGKVNDTVTLSVVIKSTNYADATVNVVITIIKATPTGEPAYTKITTSGKTLNDAALTTTGSTLNPNAGTLVWVDNAGNVLPDTTAVAANTTYKWLFTPTDTNYESISGTIKLWSKSSGGSGSYYPAGITFTTDLPVGTINRVAVNGKTLDTKNYVVNGSDVTLLQSYLDTLKAGKYTVKIENKTHVSTGTFTIKADGTLSSPRTADAGVCLYAAMALMSGTGAAYVTLRRKKEN